MELSNSTTTSSIHSNRKVVETRKVYVYDASGAPLGDYCSVTVCAQKLKLGRPRINAGLQRGSIVDSRYYISYEEKFVAKSYNYTQNPLVPRTQHPRGSRNKAGYLSAEYFEPIY